MTSLAHQSVYQHAARPEWGGAIVAWERDGKRGYQFEDGRVRVFRAGHFHLLERIDASVDRVRTLRRLLGLPTEQQASAPASRHPRPSIDEQIEYFLAAYPGGFAGTRWQGDHRGGTDRARKRHRGPAIVLAQNELTAAYLQSCLEQQREREVLETLGTVLGQTDLVASGRVQSIRALPPNRARAILVGLHELLFGTSSAQVRVVQWVQALARGTGRPAGWDLATAPLALVSPGQHIGVHRPSFIAQASSMGLQLRVPVSPTGTEYPALLAIAERVRAQLVEAACPPADLFDVRDFMVFTRCSEAVQAITGDQ